MQNTVYFHLRVLLFIFKIKTTPEGVVIEKSRLKAHSVFSVNTHQLLLRLFFSDVGVIIIAKKFLNVKR